MHDLGVRREPASERFRVLIADPDADMRDLLRLQVGMKPGCLVVGEAADGDEAIAQASMLHPDLVLLDLSMRGADGGSVMPGLRLSAPGARIVALSAFRIPTATEEELAACADGHLVKGARLRQLLDLIDEVMSN